MERGFETKTVTERTCGKYVCFVVIISLITGVLFKVFNFSSADALLFGVMAFILACPMVFSFTEPLLLACVISKLNKENIIFRNPEVVTLFNDSDVFIFDEKK